VAAGNTASSSEAWGGALDDRHAGLKRASTAAANDELGRISFLGRTLKYT